MKRRFACRLAIVLPFLSGLVFGLSIGLVFLSNDPQSSKSVRFESFVQDLLHSRFNIKRDFVFEGAENRTANIKQSGLMKQNVTILCWLYIMDTNNFFNNTKHVNATWGRKCNKIIFFIEKYNSDLPAVGFDVQISRGLTSSTSTMVLGFRYVFQTYFYEADWFIGMVGCPYIVMENLRHFLSKLDTNDPAYYGHKFWSSVDGGTTFANPYSGIVLSKGGLKLLGKKGHRQVACNEFAYTSGEQFAKCMKSIGVLLMDSRDTYGKSRFVVRSLSTQFEAKNYSFFCDSSEWKDLEPLSCTQPELSVSRELISFKGPRTLFYPGFDYFIYSLRPVVFSRNSFMIKVTDEQ